MPVAVSAMLGRKRQRRRGDGNQFVGRVEGILLRFLTFLRVFKALQGIWILFFQNRKQKTLP